MPSKAKAKTSTGIEYKRSDDLISAYANNAYFESSAWDLKIVFGQLEQPPGAPAVIRQNIAITLPWAQAKLMIYFLRAHVEANELQNGKVSIRKDLWPPEPPALAPEDQNDPVAKKVYELIKKLRDEFIASQ